MFFSDGCLLYRLNPASESYLEAQKSWRTRPNQLAETIKVMLVVCEFLKREHGYHYLARGTNQIRRMRTAYDEAFGQVDLLVMPTTPMKAPALPPFDVSREDSIAAAFAPLTNTMMFDNTHHPAMSIPCGMSDGLPVGMMLVGRHYEEGLIYQVAHAFEQHVDWRDL
jgi:amidase